MKKITMALMLCWIAFSHCAYSDPKPVVRNVFPIPAETIVSTTVTAVIPLSGTGYITVNARWLLYDGNGDYSSISSGYQVCRPITAATRYYQELSYMPTSIGTVILSVTDTISNEEGLWSTKVIAASTLAAQIDQATTMLKVQTDAIADAINDGTYNIIVETDAIAEMIHEGTATLITEIDANGTLIDNASDWIEAELDSHTAKLNSLVEDVTPYLYMVADSVATATMYYASSSISRSSTWSISGAIVRSCSAYYESALLEYTPDSLDTTPDFCVSIYDYSTEMDNYVQKRYEYWVETITEAYDLMELAVPDGNIGEYLVQE